jgi:hypothetical protein
MNRLLLAVIAPALVTAAFADEPDRKPEAKPDTAPGTTPAGPVNLVLYELRELQASPGKLDALHGQLRDHQIPLLKEHGIFTQAVFVPAGENPNELVYLLTAADGLGPMEKGWAGFHEDPKWLEAKRATESEAPLVARLHFQRLVTTYWSPRLKLEHATEPRVFELRTYTCPDPSKQIALRRRFREHTMKLFEKHGMQNIVYWTPDEDEPAFLQKLVYLLAHKSQDAAKESFAGFRADPDWIAAKKASEEAAGGSLTMKENGVLSEFLEATEYSPLR